MPTITSPQLIKELLENNGHYHDDPVPIAIYRYFNPYTEKGWAYCACYVVEDIHEMIRSPYVYEFTLLWSKGPGLTWQGEDHLKVLQGR